MQQKDSSKPATAYPPLQQPAAGIADADNNDWISSVTLLLLIGYFFFFSFTVIFPKSPEVYINSLSVSDFNVSNNQISGIWNLQLQFRNPNSYSTIHYHKLQCSLYYHRESITGIRLAPFVQRKKDQTLINATLSVSGTYVESRLADSMAEESVKGFVDFNLKLKSLVTFGKIDFSRSHFLDCDDVMVVFPESSSSGEMVGPAKRCEYA